MSEGEDVMPIRLRRGTYEVEVEHMDAVRQALVDGEARPDDEIWDPIGERWQLLGAILRTTGTDGPIRPTAPVGRRGPETPMPETPTPAGAAPSRTSAPVTRGRRKTIAVLVAALVVIVAATTVVIVLVLGRSQGGASRAAADASGPARSAAQPAVADVDAPSCDTLSKLGSEAKVAELATGDFFCERPSIAWTGKELVILYGRLGEGQAGASLSKEYEISMVRVGRSGRQVGSRVKVASDARCPFLVANGAELAASWAIGYDSANIPSDGPFGVRFARIDVSGSPIDDPEQPILTISRGSHFASAASESVSPVVAAGTELVVLGSAADEKDDGEQKVFFVPASSPSGRRNPVAIAGEEAAAPAVAWAGSGFGVVWEESSGTDDEPESRIRFVRLDRDGRRLGAGVVLGADGSSEPTLVWTGREYGLAWTECATSDCETGWVKFARLDSSGVPTGAPVQMGAFNDFGGVAPAIVWSGSEYGVAWADSRVGNAEVYFVRIGPNGKRRGEEIRVTTDAGRSGPASMAWDGSSYALVWQDLRDAGDGLYFVRIGCP
jgi:hypothetical protein